MRYLGSFPRLLAITAIVAAAGAPEEAAASEGGASFYLLGSGGPGAAVLPPLRGVFFDNTAFYYHGEAEAERQFVIGGNVVAGVDATIVADFATVMWVPTTDFAGARWRWREHSRSGSRTSRSTSS